MDAYPQEYVEDSRSRIETQLSTYSAMLAAARAAVGKENPAFDAAVASFGPLFFGKLVVVLDTLFAYRARGLE